MAACATFGSPPTTKGRECGAGILVLCYAEREEVGILITEGADCRRVIAKESQGD